MSILKKVRMFTLCNNNVKNNNKNNTSLEKRPLIINPLMNITEIELRDICKHRIDAFESWSRRIIDEIFQKEYGEDYINYMLSDDKPLIKNEIKKRITKRISDDSKRYPRVVDAILLEDIEYFLCRDDLYDRHFKNILEPFFSGSNEIRKIFGRLIPIRNKLSHSNTISLHEAEQCLCYTGDFIEVYKSYYKIIGEEKRYNVPTFFRIKDCFGNDLIRQNSEYSWNITRHPMNGFNVQLRAGDYYKLWVEVDNSFDEKLYDIKWFVTQAFSEVIAKGEGKEIIFFLSNKNVSYSPEIKIFLYTKKDWHRFGKYDDLLELTLDSVLPPIEENY